MSDRLCLFGGGLDTGNLGVDALTRSVIDAVLKREPATDIVVFDHTRGAREKDGVRFYGARWSRRVYQNDTLTNLSAAVKLGGAWNPGARALCGASAVMDISGGDSFSDLYGMKRLGLVNRPKHLAISAGVPLVLLPQTYGPFTSEEARKDAEKIVRAASVVWARDERSYATLKELLADSFDPARHRCGVDVAFALEKREPAGLPDQITAWLESDAPVAGLNVSGLIHNRPEHAREQYGLAFDYMPAVRELAEKILRDDETARLLLVPHVAPSHRKSSESDEAACEALRDTLAPEFGDRVAAAPAFGDSREAKWLISRCDWFCGTRMHPTIAGLSSGVPTSTLAYSGKAQGVFESCGQGDCVADMRTLDAGAAVGIVFTSWKERQRVRESLRVGLPPVLDAAEEQMDHIVGAALGRSAGAVSPSRVDESAA